MIPATAARHTQAPSLYSTIDAVPLLDPKWRDRAFERLNRLTKPLGSLGRLEEVAARMVAIREDLRPDCSKKTIFTLAADHGVIAEGVSAYPKEVTRQMVLNFLSDGAAINVLCRHFGINVIIVDVGVDGETDALAGLVKKKVARGTRNMAQEPAMSADEMFAALEVGRALAADAAHQGTTLIGAGEMGIGNTTAASAITAMLTGRSVADVTGRGAGLGDEGVRRKIRIVEQAIAVNRPHGSDPLDVLQKVGGLEIAGLAGLILGAAARRIPIVVDGFISSSAAAIACALQPRIRDFIFAAHRSSEPGHDALLKFIGHEPLLDLKMRLGEGTGAALCMALIESATKLLNEMATFSSAGVSEATA
ncbi:MAG TPA: nicotinate-nucleotide--dimethylbenzimidazole phosphoribosyltransferase [Candidatus Acidoferrales bacterium]|nr:nicotinate-nucleotide--dimethylbenzimidazole phosphoribosyltransferase [Candidatus Acidoferrales bacterium]